jgi:hypothetical protein
MAERAAVEALFTRGQPVSVRGTSASSPAGLSAQPDGHYLHK